MRHTPALFLDRSLILEPMLLSTLAAVRLCIGDEFLRFVSGGLTQESGSDQKGSGSVFAIHKMIKTVARLQGKVQERE